jgi:hypothetical protein
MYSNIAVAGDPRQVRPRSRFRASSRSFAQASLVYRNFPVGLGELLALVGGGALELRGGCVAAGWPLRIFAGWGIL